MGEGNEQRRAPGGDEFKAAIAARSDAWFAACLRITGSRQAAEDAVQDGLLAAWTKRHQFQRSSRLETWIHRITVNAALQQLRRRQPTALDPADIEIEDTAARPEDRQRHAELEGELRSAFGGLTDIERVCFALKHLEDWRLQEIAGEVDVTVGAVKQAVFRAVRKLRSRMPELQRTNS